MRLRENIEGYARNLGREAATVDDKAVASGMRSEVSQGQQTKKHTCTKVHHLPLSSLGKTYHKAVINSCRHSVPTVSYCSVCVL